MKNKQIEILKRKVDYTLKLSRRARRLRLTIHRGGDFVVTAPKDMEQNVIERFIINKSEWILRKMDYFTNFPVKIFVKNKNKNKHYLAHKKIAQELVQSRIYHFNKIYNFKFNKITIRNQKSRWGSCSSKGNLNFNYRMALISPIFSDYIVVHELCHLGEFNHSQKFWNLVEMAIPDYRGIKCKLKRNLDILPI